MNYFIDDMLGPSRKSFTKSTPTSPAPTEPPLSPAPSSSSKSRKGKSTKSWRGQSSSAAASVPLPETPLPPKVSSEPGIPSPKSAATTVAKSDYFTGVELVPPAGPSTNPDVQEPPAPGSTAFFTPMPEPPQGDLEVPPLAEISTKTESSSGEALVAEKQQPIALPDERDNAEKEMPPERIESPPPTLYVVHDPIPVVHSKPAIMIGLSGSPESGKTTLAYLLSLVLPPTTPSFIIHQDDFFVRKHLLIPNDNDGDLEVKYRRTVDFTAFKKLIEYSKREGRLPPGFRSLQPKGDQESVLSQISPELVEELRASLADLPGLQDGRPVGIVDGFLLYHSSTIRSLLDMKILLRASKQASKKRRSERVLDDQNGLGQDKYAWESVDYFDRIVWQNYEDEHAVLFEDGDVEGNPILSICEGVKISVQPDLKMGLAEVLQWVVDVFKKGHEVSMVHTQDREMVEVVDEYEACRCNEGFLGKIRQAIFDRI